jgi:membrane glycosyltransferase
MDLFSYLSSSSSEAPKTMIEKDQEFLDSIMKTSPSKAPLESIEKEVIDAVFTTKPVLLEAIENNQVVDAIFITDPVQFEAVETLPTVPLKEEVIDTLTKTSAIPLTPLQIIETEVLDLHQILSHNISQNMWTNLMSTLCTVRKSHESKEKIDQCILYLQTHRTNMDVLLIAYMVNDGIVFKDERSLTDLTEDLCEELKYLND